MTSHERPDPRHNWSGRSLRLIRDPRGSRGPRETDASILYSLLVGIGLFVVGIVGLFGEPEFPRGAAGELLRNILTVDPARNTLHAAVGLASVLFLFARRSNTYCLATGALFTVIGAFGLLFGASLSTVSVLNLASIAPIASMAYLAFGVLGVWCGLASRSAPRDTDRSQGPAAPIH